MYTVIIKIVLIISLALLFSLSLAYTFLSLSSSLSLYRLSLTLPIWPYSLSLSLSLSPLFFLSPPPSIPFHFPSSPTSPPSSASNISSQAPDHIHSSEVLMTTGYSKTVEAFLKVNLLYTNLYITWSFVISSSLSTGICSRA